MNWHLFWQACVGVTLAVVFAAVLMACLVALGYGLWVVASAARNAASRGRGDRRAA